MNDFRHISELRRDYGDLCLNKDVVNQDPIVQFQLWLEEVLRYEESDPTAMVLSTVDAQGYPDSRVVLLKGLHEGHFIFYTNYQSAKAKQINENPRAALNFYWPHLSRQVRIRGKLDKTSQEVSDQYFNTRPLENRFSAIISAQSQEIASRFILEKSLNDLLKKNKKKCLRPDYWGGYQLCPDLIEFWQGRNNRLHDRIQYSRQKEKWRICRLAP